MRLSRDARNYLLFGTMLFVVLEALLAVAIIWWPSFSENTGALKRLAAPLPMLADQLNLIDMIGVPAYVVAQHFFKGCNTLGAAAAVLLAMNAVAGEAQRGILGQLARLIAGAQGAGRSRIVEGASTCHHDTLPGAPCRA